MQTKEKAAASQRASLAAQQEFMSLAPGVGIIPEEYRNLGYRKLDFEPGEGGIGNLLADREQSKTGGDGANLMGAFLAGVAAGADPQKLASELRSPDKTTTRRARSAGKEVTA